MPLKLSDSGDFRQCLILKVPEKSRKMKLLIIRNCHNPLKCNRSSGQKILGTQENMSYELRFGGSSGWPPSYLNVLCVFQWVCVRLATVTTSPWRERESALETFYSRYTCRRMVRNNTINKIAKILFEIFYISFIILILGGILVLFLVS